SNALFQIRAHTFVPPSGFLRLVADEAPGPNHLGFKLPAAAGLIALYDSTGAEITRVNYKGAAEGVTIGRVPDATGHPVPLPGTPSPGASNYVPLAFGPRLNEIMAAYSGSGTVPAVPPS